MVTAHLRYVVIGVIKYWHTGRCDQKSVGQYAGLANDSPVFTSIISIHVPISSNQGLQGTFVEVACLFQPNHTDGKYNDRVYGVGWLRYVADHIQRN